jgi:hypothetical protein
MRIVFVNTEARGQTPEVRGGGRGSGRVGEKTEGRRQ